MNIVSSTTPIFAIIHTYIKIPIPINYSVLQFYYLLVNLI